MVDAYVNHGRWVVNCPSCPSAALAGVTFACSECGFGPAGVQWPEEAALIEAALRPRPLVNRNWVPGESVTDLVRENEVHREELLS
jgi:hypothetical protein